MHPSQTIRAQRRRAAHIRWSHRPEPDPCAPPPPIDWRRPIPLPLSAAGGDDLTLHPIPGRIAWRAVRDADGATVASGALKSMLRDLADRLPRMQAMQD